MKTFSEWLVLEVKIKCNSCGHEGTAGSYDWNAGNVRCRQCGGSVEKIESNKKNDKNKVLDPEVFRAGGYKHRGKSSGSEED